MLTINKASTHPANWPKEDGFLLQAYIDHTLPLNRAVWVDFYENAVEIAANHIRGLRHTSSRGRDLILAIEVTSAFEFFQTPNLLN